MPRSRIGILPSNGCLAFSRKLWPRQALCTPISNTSITRARAKSGAENVEKQKSNASKQNCESIFPKKRRRRKGGKPMTKKLNIMSLSVDPEIQERLKSVAKKRNVSVSKLVRDLIEKYLGNDDDSHEITVIL